MDQYPQPLKSPQEMNCTLPCVLQSKLLLVASDNEISTGSYQIDFRMIYITSC